MSRPLSRANAILLAVVVLVAVGLGALGVFTLGGWHSGGHFDMRAGFDEVRGVEPGTGAVTTRASAPGPFVSCGGA